MNKTEREKAKEIERLKWDYWNESELFQLFWKYTREKIKDKRAIENKFKKDKGRELSADEVTNFIASSCPPPDQLRPKIAEGRGERNHSIWSATREYWYYFMYHNPEDGSFDEYWAFSMDRRQTIERNEKSYKRVEDYRELITGDIDAVVLKFKREENREPTIDELKDCLVNDWMNHASQVFLMITLVNRTHKEALERGREVGQFLKKRCFGTKLEIKPLRKYLTAMKLKDDNAMSYGEIFEKLENVEHYSDKERAAKRFVSNARKIIKNLEMGRHPWWCLSGRYSRLPVVTPRQMNAKPAP